MTICLLRDGVDPFIAGDTCRRYGKVYDGVWRHWRANADCVFAPRIEMCAPRPAQSICEFPWMMGPNKFRFVPIQPSRTLGDWGLE